MSTSSDSAEEIVRLSLEGFEVVAKLTGNMAKEMAVLLYAMTKEKKKKTVGQTRLNNMLKSNSNLRIFTIKKEDFQDFKKQSKRYGVLYSALYKKGEVNKDGIIDILVKEEDAVRVNRIIERFKLTTVTQTAVETALGKSEVEKNVSEDKEKTEVSKEIQEKNTSQELLNKLLKKENDNEVNNTIIPSKVQNAAKENQSENLLKQKEGKIGINKVKKDSIREKIKNIEKQNSDNKTKEKTINKKTNILKHKQSKNRKRKGASRV